MIVSNPDEYPSHRIRRSAEFTQALQMMLQRLNEIPGGA